MSRITPASTVLCIAALTVALLAAASPAFPQVAAAPSDTDLEALADSLFAAFDSDASPGCAVGVEVGGEPVLTRAWGMANLEWGIPNTPGTIFENGSVSKQFTAAAVVLLVLDGKLSLEDDVRTYVPELPDYGHTITLRHLLNHTSGLRDWGSVAGISGWGRSVRTHTHDHVLDILGRQTALNFEPGHEYSYSNSGFNLLAVVVSRVSGMSFAEFSRERIFKPLGMTDTHWRDDWTRIVPGRSTAYSPTPGGGWRINQPIENVHGNGGLLTTVGDLLTWNRALDEANLAGPEFVEMMETQGVLNDGRTISYALGLFVGDWRGVRTVSHGGATSGYRAYLARYPDQEISAAVLCNASTASTGSLTSGVVRPLLENAFGPVAELPGGVTLDGMTLDGMAGLYRDLQTGEPGRLEVDDDGVLRFGRTTLVPLSATEFQVGSTGQRLVRGPGSGRTGFRVEEEGAVTARWAPVDEFEPTAHELGVYVGTYHSDDAETTFRVTVDGDRLVVHRRPADVFPGRPVYLDVFETRLGLVRFIRGADGAVTGLSLGQSRVYDMRFRRVE